MARQLINQLSCFSSRELSCKGHASESTWNIDEIDDSHDFTEPPERPITQLPRVSFLELCRQQRFDEIVDLLRDQHKWDLEGWLFQAQTRRGLHRWMKKAIIEQQNLHIFRGESPLHILLHYNPTRMVVDRLIKFMSTSNQSLCVPEEAVDMRGRTPLHVAVANGCSVAVIDRLLKGVSMIMPIFAKDFMGRHALHLACINPTGQCYNSTTASNHSESCIGTGRHLASRKNMFYIIGLLLDNYGEAVILPDHTGKTPYDLAWENKADEDILMILDEEKSSHMEEVRLRANAISFYTDSTESSRACIDVQENGSFRDDISSLGSTDAWSYKKKKRVQRNEAQWHSMSTIDECPDETQPWRHDSPLLAYQK